MGYLTIVHFLLLAIIVTLESNSAQRESANDHVREPVNLFRHGFQRVKRAIPQSFNSPNSGHNAEIGNPGHASLNEPGPRKLVRVTRQAFGRKLRARQGIYIGKEDRPGGYHTPGGQYKPRPSPQSHYGPGSPPYSDNPGLPPGWYDYGYTGPPNHGYDSGRRRTRKVTRKEHPRAGWHTQRKFRRPVQDDEADPNYDPDDDPLYEDIWQQPDY